MKSVIEISEQAIRLMENVIKNEIPTESCPEKNQRANWKREQVRQEIIQRLSAQTNNSVGPSEIK